MYIEVQYGFGIHSDVEIISPCRISDQTISIWKSVAGSPLLLEGFITPKASEPHCQRLRNTHIVLYKRENSSLGLEHVHNSS